MAMVRYTLQGSCALIQMDDGKANALSEAMLTELDDALSRAEGEARALVLAGRPERFSAGFDLKTMMSGPDAAKALVLRGADLFLRLYGFPLPVVAACTGHALAGGALLLLCADVRVGATGAFRIGLNEVAIGLPTPVLAVELARDRIVTTQLARATLQAQIYGPDDAVGAGFLDEVAAPEQVLERAMQVATRLGELSRHAYEGSKKRLRGRTIAYIASSIEEDLRTIGPAGT
jgi:enoyl-CoA hydratase